MWIRLAAVSLLLFGRTVAAAAAPEVEYRDDRLTVHMQEVPIADAVRALEIATGADVHGKIPPAGEVSIELDAVPLHEALGRIFGERNYSITYRGDGRPAAIELFGAPLPAVARPAAAPAPAPAPAEERAGPGWPADQATRDAVITLQQFLERNPSVDLPPGLAKALGAPSVTYRDLVKAAATNENRGVRLRAWRLSVRTLREDPALWDAFRQVITTAPEDSMRDFTRHLLGPRAEELTHELMARSDPQIRGSARVILDQLRAQDGADGT
jgi:hypothetical protein